MADPLTDDLFARLIDSEIKIEILYFFRSNPGTVDTVEGLAARIGRSPEVVQKSVNDFVKVGILEQKKIGDSTVIIFNKDKDMEIRQRMYHQKKGKVSGKGGG